MTVATEPPSRTADARPYLAPLVFAALLLANATAAAGEPARNPASADDLFRQGRTLAIAQDYLHACPKFAESLRLDPAAGTLLNLADCEEQIGHLASAWEHFKELGDQLPRTDERKDIALERARNVERRLPHLVIELSLDTPEATVRRDDVELGRSSFGVPLPVDPGEHTVLVSQPGGTPWQMTFALAEGQSRTLIVGSGDVIPLELALPEELAASSSAHRTKRTAGWIVGGVGIAALATGTYFGVRALEKRGDSDAHCNGDICTDPASAQAYEDAKGDARMADIGLAIGVVSACVAGYLLLTSSSAEAPIATPPRRRLALELRPTGLAVAW
jgi:hypothetical protein